MRNYPRNDQARRDAEKGSGHIGNHGPVDKQSAKDRQLRYEPAINPATGLLAAYGGGL